MRYLVDTDWAVWWLRGRPDVVQRLRELRTDGLAISAVTLGELVTGVRRSRAQASNEEALQHFLRRVTVLPFTDATAYRWGDEQARLLDAGETITEFDLAIAANRPPARPGSSDGESAALRSGCWPQAPVVSGSNVICVSASNGTLD